MWTHESMGKLVCSTCILLIARAFVSLKSLDSKTESGMGAGGPDLRFVIVNPPEGTLSGAKTAALDLLGRRALHTHERAGVLG